MFGLLAWPLFVGFEQTITFLERRNRRTALRSQGTHSTLETFALNADKEVQKIILSWTSGRCMTMCRAVPIVLPRTAPQHMYTHVKCRRIADPFHSSCVPTHRHNTNIFVEMHTARCQFAVRGTRCGCDSGYRHVTPCSLVHGVTVNPTRHQCFPVT